jgi:hypothetical protein
MKGSQGIWPLGNMVGRERLPDGDHMKQSIKISVKSPNEIS